jgi:hypothetical protein
MCLARIKPCWFEALTWRDIARARLIKSGGRWPRIAKAGRPQRDDRSLVVVGVHRLCTYQAIHWQGRRSDTSKATDIFTHNPAHKASVVLIGLVRSGRLVLNYKDSWHLFINLCISPSKGKKKSYARFDGNFAHSNLMGMFSVGPILLPSDVLSLQPPSRFSLKSSGHLTAL